MELCVTSNISSRLADRTPIPFAKTVALARMVGFAQMDFDITTATVRDASSIRAALQEQKMAGDAGIVFRYAHLPFDYPKTPEGWTDFDTATRRAIDLAAELGVECAAIHPKTHRTREYDRDALWEAALAYLTPYAEYAKSAGVTLALENMRGAGKSADPAIRRYGTEAEDVWELAEALDIGICWDTGHGNISGQDAYASLVRIAPRLKMLHVNDNFAEDDVHIAPYLGNVDWKGTAAALKEIGFKGAVNLEVGCNRLPEPLRPAYAAYMAEAAKKLRDAIVSE